MKKKKKEGKERTYNWRVIKKWGQEITFISCANVEFNFDIYFIAIIAALSSYVTK